MKYALALFVGALVLFSGWDSGYALIKTCGPLGCF
jgi:hypothetical protein